MKTIENAKKAMKEAIEHFEKELKNIRTGRAHSGMIEGVRVEMYGSQMRILDLATISTPEPMQLLITPFDRTSVGPIGKAIERANLGFMPIVEGAVVRINIPPMDGTMREKMKKNVREQCEQAKVRIRHIRKEANDAVKADKESSEDERKRHEKEVQDLTDKNCKLADDLAHKKEHEITTV